MAEFFGFGGYQRTPEGYFSWQHLLFVSCLMVIMIASAVLIGLRYRHKDEKAKNVPLIVAAIAIDAFEIFKIVLCCIREGDPFHWRLNLPLFLCSIQLITIPLAAFAKGRLKEAALDFVFIFGALGAVAGTYFAGQNYGAYPVLSFDNVVSGITHSISGFAAIYIGVSGLVSMKKENVIFTLFIMAFFCIVAYVCDLLIPYNYMFLMRGDGTPYDIFYDLVNGNRILYPLTVMFLFMLYMAAVYGTAYVIPSFRKQAFAKETVDLQLN